MFSLLRFGELKSNIVHAFTTESISAFHFVVVVVVVVFLVSSVD